MDIRASFENIPKKGQLVYVDDEHQNIFLFERYFGEHFNLKCISAPIEAMKFVESNDSVLVVVTDHSMPSMTGLEMAKQIKEKKNYVKLIMITGNPENDDQLMYNSLKENVFFDFINKPLDFENKFDLYLKTIKKAFCGAWESFSLQHPTKSFELMPPHYPKQADFNGVKKMFLLSGLSMFPKLLEDCVYFTNTQDDYEAVMRVRRTPELRWSFEVEEVDTQAAGGKSNKWSTVLTSNEIDDVFNILLGAPEYRKYAVFFRNRVGDYKAS